MSLFGSLSRTADRIEAVLSRHRAPAAVVGGHVLPSFVEMLLVPAPGTRVNQIKSLQADIALAVGSPSVRIAQAGLHVAVQIPRTQRHTVRLSALMQGMQSHELPRFAAVLGMAEGGAPLLARLSSPQVSHVLIAGATGSGKTSLAQAMLISLCQKHRPHELGIVWLDPKKRNEQDPCMRRISTHLLMPPAHTPAAILDAIDRIVEVMGNRSTAAHPAPRIVVYVDELAELCLTGGARVVDQLTRIAQRGREPGIHLIACTQKPTSKAIGSQLKANLPLRLVGKVLSTEDARVASGMAGTGAERMAGNGDFIAVNGGNVIRFQAALPD